MSSDAFIEYLKQKMSLDQSKYLEEFEKLNTTTSSIHELGNLDVLIILKDGTNLTSWDDVENKRDIIYVSEDLSECFDLSSKYSGLTSLRAIVVTQFPEHVITTENMFYSCMSLVDISSLKDMVVSNVRVMNSMFHGCNSITDFSALKEWDVSDVRHMDGMFNSCRSFSDLDFLKYWDVSNVESMNHMFFGCWALTNLWALKKWDVSNVENMGWMFSGCKNLLNADGLEDWKVKGNLNLEYMFMGCESLENVSAMDDWSVNFSRTLHTFYCCSSLKRQPDWSGIY